MQTLLPQHVQASEGGTTLLAKQAGFSLLTGVALSEHARNKVERLCRYIAKAAVPRERLSLSRSAKIYYALKMLYTDGKTHMVFDYIEFITRLASTGAKARR